MLLVEAATGQVSFEMLETPRGGYWTDFALSRDGRSMGCVLGGAIYWWTAVDGFRFVDEGAPSGGGIGISADGNALISARSHGTGSTPAVWYRDGSRRDVGSLASGCDTAPEASSGYDLAGDGSAAVGQAATCTGTAAFVWTRDRGLAALPMPAGGNARATAISADGRTIVGFSEHPAGGRRRPALWRDGKGPEFLLGTRQTGEALGVSLNGRYVVGQADLSGLHPRAFLWAADTGPVELGGLGGLATDTSLARAASDDGKVVGWCGDTLWGDQVAFIWTAQAGMRAVADILTESGIRLPPGIVLTGAFDISGDGTTVVGVCRDRDWNERYWRIQLGDVVAPAPPARTDSPRPRGPATETPDSLGYLGADLFDAFPFGKRRYPPQF